MHKSRQFEHMNLSFLNGMIKIIITLVIILWVHAVSAQTFWNKVENNQTFVKSEVTSKGLLADSIILVGGKLNKLGCYSYGLFAYNLQGQNMWLAEGFHEVVCVKSGSVYTVGVNYHNDDVVGDEKIIVGKYNNQGQEIFSIEYPLENYSFSYNLIMDIAHDDALLVNYKNLFLKGNANGGSLSPYASSLSSEVKGLKAISASKYLIYTTNTVYLLDSAFQPQDSIVFTSTLGKIQLLRDTLYALLGSYVIRMDTSLQLVDTVYAADVPIQSIEVYNNNLWLQLNENNQAKILKLQDNNVLLSQTFPLLANDVQFLVAGNKFIFVGNSFSEQLGLYQFEVDNSSVGEVHLPDIELIDVVMDSVTPNYVEGSLYGYRFNPVITVKNKGTDTIRSFAVYAMLHGGMNCATNQYYQTIESIELLPGDTQTFKLARAFEANNNNTELCFECLAPNAMLETETGNNKLCKMFSSVTNKAVAGIKVYPNPVFNHLTLELPVVTQANVEIRDIAGRTLKQHTFSGSRITLTTTDLKPGIYFIKVKMQTETYTQKIIKE
ncbi:MAG: T9SS type A sorting domain-containing protein [Bacteroidales bacterium]